MEVREIVKAVNILYEHGINICNGCQYEHNACCPTERMLVTCKARLNKMPTSLHYANLLSMAKPIEPNKENARDRFGMFTYAQWAKLLESLKN